jgi:hypothetical protein
MIQVVYPGILMFYPSRIPVPGFKGQKAPDTESRIRIRNTVALDV